MSAGHRTHSTGIEANNRQPGNALLQSFTISPWNPILHAGLLALKALVLSPTRETFMHTVIIHLMYVHIPIQALLVILNLLHNSQRTFRGVHKVSYRKNSCVFISLRELCHVAPSPSKNICNFKYCPHSLLDLIVSIKAYAKLGIKYRTVADQSSYML